MLCFGSRNRSWLSLSFAAITACALSTACDENSASDPNAKAFSGVAQWSYVGEAVYKALAKYPEMEGVTWSITHDNVFSSNWLINTPSQKMWGEPLSSLSVPAPCTSNCDADFALKLCKRQSDCTGGGTCKPVLASVKYVGQSPKSMCVGHSMDLVDRFYTTVASAERFVDVSSLSPADVQFRAALRNAITRLSTKANPPTVRIISAEIPFVYRVNTRTETEYFTKEISKNSNIRVSVAAYRSSNTEKSFDHAKFIAVDGKVVIAGGHNMWSKQYLMKSPVNDTSIEVRGGAAAQAHRFANELWDYVCENENWWTYMTWSVWQNTWIKGKVTDECAANFNYTPAMGPSSGTVIAVGRLGSGIHDGGNQTNVAQLALIRSAKETLRIVQQDIGPVTLPYLGFAITDWPKETLDALADALIRGVDVYIVLSNLDATAGGLPMTEATYSNGWTVEEVGDEIKDALAARPGAPQGAALDDLVCDKLHMAPFRYNTSEATWPDGTPLPNHSKIVQVDEQGLYVTSDNMYPANLQEFGLIVDDSRVVADWLDTYWDNAWEYSSSAAVSGFDAPSCEL